MAIKEPLNSKKYVDGIYIPAGLIVLGTAICKREWLPYAVVLAVALGAIKFLRTRKFFLPRRLAPMRDTELGRGIGKASFDSPQHYRTQEGPQARCLPGV